MTILNVGSEAFNCTEIAEKVQADMRFLRHRLQLMTRQPNPNLVVMQTYRDMLEARQAVWDWLVQDHKVTINQ